ncbi:MAG: hypothetical protein WC959_10855 [Kiritimatiellales bacterium]
MKNIITAIALGFIAGTAGAGITFDFYRDPAVYTDMHLQAGPVTLVTNGLQATFSASTGVMSCAHSTGLGIHTAGGDEAGRYLIDPGEVLLISFDQDVIFTFLHFISFTEGETFVIRGDNIVLNGVATDQCIINYHDLDGLPIKSCTNMVFSVPAGTELQFTVADGFSSIGLRAFTVDVIPEPATTGLAVMLLVGTLFFYRRFYQQ